MVACGRQTKREETLFAKQNATLRPRRGALFEHALELVVAAGQGASPASKHALSELCRQYWVPIYGYVRRRMPDMHEAQDLTQESPRQGMSRLVS